MQDYVLLSREKYEFQKGMLTDEEIVLLIVRNQMSIGIFIVLEVLLSFLWLAAGAVPGFALYNGLANQLNAYTHLIWWFAIELACIAFGIYAILFGIGYSVIEQKPERNVSRTITKLNVYFWILGLSVTSHILHVIFSCFELYNCSSSLCSNYRWVLITGIALWATWAVVNVWMMIRVVVYRNNLTMAIQYGRLDMALIVATAPPTASGNNSTSNKKDVAVVIEHPLNTPLLAQLNNSRRHKLK
ncbi:MAG: hypothetical protein K2Q45_03270 [Nitrosomonas sp.]|nr:hypothetical protein [Nitrosomonas sp.]